VHAFGADASPPRPVGPAATAPPSPPTSRFVLTPGGVVLTPHQQHLSTGQHLRARLDATISVGGAPVAATGEAPSSGADGGGE
jgi:hypothetical protein